MDRIEALATLRSLEKLTHWSEDEGNEDDEAIWILALSIRNSFAALAMMLGLVEHAHTCRTCETNQLEEMFDE